MRRTLLVTAALAAAAAATPAMAYEAPRYTCTTAIAYFSMDHAPTQSCTSGDAPHVNGLVTFRQFHVLVASGDARATLTCKNAWWSSTDSALLYASTEVQTIEVVEDAGMTCTATLGSGTHGSVAAGFTSFTYRYPYGA